MDEGQVSSFPEPSRPLNGGRQATFPRPQRTWASIQTLHTRDRRSARACLIVESLRCTHIESCPCKTTFKSQIVTGRPPRAHIPAGTAPPSTPLSSGCPASPARRSHPSRLQGRHPGFSLLVPHLRPLSRAARGCAYSDLHRKGLLPCLTCAHPAARAAPKGPSSVPGPSGQNCTQR